MKLESPRLPVNYVATGEGLDALLADLASCSQIGLDAERASGFRYSQRAYLIQISTRQSIYLVDPESEQLPTGWNQLLASAMAPLTWILHSATQDLPCLAELGITPTSIADTELAARFVGVERFGLASLAQQFLDLELEKEHSAADWSVRPLSPSMQNYAALDVDVLFELWDSLEAALAGSEKRAWLQQELERLVGFSPRPQSEQPWRGLPGMAKIRDLPRQQIAASLWVARDRLAQELDVAPGRLIPDRAIAAVVAHPPASKRELANNREFHGRASRSKLDTWWQAIADAPNFEITPLPPDPNHVPNHRSWDKRFPEAHARLSEVRPKLLDLATSHSLSIELLLTPDTLRRVCFNPAQDLEEQLRTLGARSWQIELCAPIISETFANLEPSEG